MQLSAARYRGPKTNLSLSAFLLNSRLPFGGRHSGCCATYAFHPVRPCDREADQHTAKNVDHDSNTAERRDASNSVIEARQGSTFWYENIQKQGRAAFNPTPNDYKVYRNVKDYGARGKISDPQIHLGFTNTPKVMV